MRDQRILEEVKAILAELVKIAPGHAVEVRVPPYAAVQCVEGPKHTRGTPPNVVELSYETLINLLNGKTHWSSGIETGAIHASGERSDLSSLFEVLAKTIRITS
ncbi:MAG: sterol carrier family protein [Actinomycetes bacterium]